MAKVKNTVEYFPFIVKDGRTIFVLKRKFDLAGIGFFTELFRFLSQEPEHWICLQDEFDEERLIKFVMGSYIDEKKQLFYEMLDVLIMTGKIDKTLWETKKVIVSEDFVDNLQALYNRRTLSINMKIIRENVKNLPDYTVDNMSTYCLHIAPTLLKKKCIEERIGKDRIGEERKEEERKEEERERKGNNPPPFFSQDQKKQHLDFVFLSDQEYKTLCSEWERSDIDNYIKKLNDHIGSTAKQYASHYFTLRKWMEQDSNLVKKKTDNNKKCVKCGKVYSYSTEHGKCNDCRKVEVEEDTRGFTPDLDIRKIIKEKKRKAEREKEDDEIPEFIKGGVD